MRNRGSADADALLTAVVAHECGARRVLEIVSAALLERPD
jgi:hypothetical protein